MTEHHKTLRSLIDKSELSTRAIARGANVSEENLTKWVSKRVNKIDVSVALAVYKFLTGETLKLKKTLRK